jgi:hypothetical protein
MTRTEERLTDALAARAAAVREDSLRPLTAPAREPRRVVGRWLTRLVPLSAAIGLAAAVVLVVEAGHLVHQRPSSFGSFADIATASSPPPYYVQQQTNVMIVRSTKTSRKTEAFGAPYPWNYVTTPWGVEDAVAGSANGKVFVAALTDESRRRTALFRFSLTRSGRVTGFHQIPHAVIFGLDQVSLAVSPDGTWAAISGTPQTRSQATGGDGFPRGQARIIVVSTLTGQLKVWQGGLTRPGSELTFPSISWGPSDSLYVLAQWCKSGIWQGVCLDSHPVTVVRRIDAAGPGGSLSNSSVLLRGTPVYPLILQAVVTADGRSIIALIGNGSHVTVVRFDARTGQPIAVPYRLQGRNYSGMFLTIDGTGRYIFLDGNLFGWLHDGRFHDARNWTTAAGVVAW